MAPAICPAKKSSSEKSSEENFEVGSGEDIPNASKEAKGSEPKASFTLLLLVPLLLLFVRGRFSFLLLLLLIGCTNVGGRWSIKLVFELLLLLVGEMMVVFIL